MIKDHFPSSYILKKKITVKPNFSIYIFDRRSAGDGCSPSNSAAVSQDNLRPCLEHLPINSPITTNYEEKNINRQHASIDKNISQPAEYLKQNCQNRQDVSMYCDDPEHLEATQIILEMHQVLADR